MLGIVASVENEVEGLRQNLKLSDWHSVDQLKVTRSPSGHPAVIIAVGGVGRGSAELATHHLIDIHQVKAVVNLGFAGGTQPKALAGHLVVCSQAHLYYSDYSTCLSSEAEGQVVECDADLLNLAEEVAKRIETKTRIPYHKGSTVTANQIIGEPAKKVDLGKCIGSVAVDMESYWVGRVTKESRIPFLAVRVILDEVRDWMPDVLEFISPSGSVLVGPAMKYASEHPRRIPDMMRLGGRLRLASQRLTQFGTAFVDELEHDATNT